MQGRAFAFWHQFSLHCNIRGWDSVREFAIYTLRKDVSTYFECQQRLFHTRAISDYVEDENEVSFGFIPRSGFRKHALDVIATIATYIRQLRWEAHGRAIFVVLPRLEFPEDSHYIRCIRVHHVTLAEIGDDQVFNRVSPIEKFRRHFRELMNSCAMNILYPKVRYPNNDTKVTLAKLIYPDAVFASSVDMLHYRWFSQRNLSASERRDRYYCDKRVYSPIENRWVPEIFLFELRYYTVRRNTLKRMFARFAESHRLSIDKLLWEPPGGLMIKRGWREITVLNGDSNQQWP